MEENQVQIFAEAIFSPKIFKKTTISEDIYGSICPSWGISQNIHKNFANTAENFSRKALKSRGIH
jgi:hypothetical protein